MGAASSSKVSSESIFNQNISTACNTGCKSSNSATDWDFSNTVGCTVTLMQSADCIANCDMSTIAEAVVDTALAAGSTAESDLLPSISISDASSVTDVEQYLSSECSATAIAENTARNWNFSGAVGCEVDLTQYAESSSACAVAAASAAFAENDVSATSSTATTALGTFMDGLSSIVGSLTTAYAIVVVAGLAILGLFLFLVIKLFGGNAKKAVSSAVKSVNTGNTVGTVTNAMIGGLTMSDTSPALTLTDFI